MWLRRLPYLSPTITSRNTRAHLKPCASLLSKVPVCVERDLGLGIVVQLGMSAVDATKDGRANFRDSARTWCTFWWLNSSHGVTITRGHQGARRHADGCRVSPRTCAFHGSRLKHSPRRERDICVWASHTNACALPQDLHQARTLW